MSNNDSNEIKGFAGKPPGEYSYGGGLSLRVSPAGLSTWFVRLTVGHKRTQRKIGRASPSNNTAWARRKAVETIQEAESGELLIRRDPTPTDIETTATLGALVNNWADSLLAQDRWTSRHHEKTVARIELHMAELWGRPYAELSRVEINTHLSKMESIDTAGRVFGWVKEALENAVDLGKLDFCVLGRRPKSFVVPKKHRNNRKSYGTDYPKLKALYNRIRLSDRSRSVRLAGQLCILTGLRLGEVINLHADYFDGEALVIPRDKMKEKDTWRGDFTVPLAPPALEIINEAILVNGQGWLFPGPQTGRPISHEGVEKVFRNYSNREHVPHGSRTSLYTWALELDTPLQLADSLIDHATSKGSGEHYDQTQYIRQRKKLLEEWAQLISG